MEEVDILEVYRFYLVVLGAVVFIAAAILWAFVKIYANKEDKENKHGNKYEVEFKTVYKWAQVSEVWIVEAENEDQALDLIKSGEGEQDISKTKLVNTDKVISDEHLRTTKI